MICYSQEYDRNEFSLTYALSNNIAKEMVYQSWEFDVKSLGTSQSQICIVFAEAEGAWTIYWLADPKDSSKYIFYEWVYKVIVAVSITPLYNKFDN